MFKCFLKIFLTFFQTKCKKLVQIIILVKSYETNQPTNMATESQSTSSTGSYVVNFDDYGAQQSSTYDTQNTKGYNPSMEEFQFVPTSASQGKCLNRTRCEFYLSDSV